MTLRTFDPGLAFDKATGKGIGSTLAVVSDAVDGTPVDTFDMSGNPAPVITNRDGYFGQFKADADRIRIQVANIVMEASNLEAIVEASTAATAAQAAAEAAQVAAEAAAASATAPDNTAIDARISSGLSPAVKKGDLVFNIRDYGAVGNGTTVDTTAVQAALTAAGVAGGSVYAPPGRYLCGALTVPSKVNLYGSPGTVFVISGTPTNWLTVQGTLGTEVALAAAATAGDTALTTAAAHGLVAGDLARIVSQRNALHTDATDQWQLGNNTPTATTCYFGEVVRVAAAPTTTTLTTDVGLLFPNYRPDATLETSVDARAAATVAKFNPARDVRISNFTIEGRGSTTAILVQLGYNVLVQDVELKASGNTSFVIFEACLNCRADGCRILYPDLLTDPAQHHLRNAYKTHGSQDCGFVRCYADRATQAFDLTYGGLTPRLPSVGCYVEMCSTKGAVANPITTHPGTYACRITNNRFLENKLNGIANRCRSAIISGNTVTGSRATGSYGITLYEGWARNCIVSHNVISAFEEPITIADGGSEVNERFTWVGATIVNNIITQFGSFGIRITRQTANQYIGETGILISGNTIAGSYWPNSSSKGIFGRAYVVGMRIVGNFIDLGGIGNAGIHIPANSSDHVIEGNTIINGSNRGVWVDAATDSTTWPSGVKVYLGNGNRFASVTNRYFLPAGVTAPARFLQGGTGNTGSVVTVTGSRGGNAALASLLTQLAAAGLITDSTTA